jgi:hypothetical protein
MGEILQTGPNAGPMSMLFDELLVPAQTNLVWKASGPGRGTEMRRAFSGLFGRFFARAYLQHYHGFTWFAPIDGSPTNFSMAVRIKRKRGRKAELPDWLCAGPGRLAIAEAKGSHQKGNATKGGRPGPIKTAAGQIDGVVVEQSRRINGVRRWVPRSVKAWAVMSRWGVENPQRDAFQYVLDPETTGESLSETERDEIVQVVARVHVGQILEGLGYGDLGGELAPVRTQIATRSRQAAGVEMEGEEKRAYLGAAISPFGVLPISIAEARGLLDALPDALLRQIRFVGMDVDVVTHMRDHAEVEPRTLRRSDDGTRIGPDGLLMAPLDRIFPRAIAI